MVVFRLKYCRAPLFPSLLYSPFSIIYITPLFVTLNLSHSSSHFIFCYTLLCTYPRSSYFFVHTHVSSLHFQVGRKKYEALRDKLLFFQIRREEAISRVQQGGILLYPVRSDLTDRCFYKFIYVVFRVSAFCSIKMEE